MMNKRFKFWLGGLALAAAAVALLILFLLNRNPIAHIQVVDSAGRPVPGVTLYPDGMRTKQGPYSSGWYGWRTGQSGVLNPPVITDADGRALIPYPRYVFERIETGVLCLRAEHSDFAPARPECTVDVSPPIGAPLKELLTYWLTRLRHGGVAKTKPIVLELGSILRVALRPGAEGPNNVMMFAEATGLSAMDSNTWLRSGSNIITTRRLPPGPFAVRALKIASTNQVWFSEVVTNIAMAGHTNLVELSLRPGATVRGKLTDSGLPVTNGRVIANVWPCGLRPEDSPPQWHAWSPVRSDGSFEFPPLPPGDLEVVALCDGFVSTNGPGQFGMRYPQKHVLGTSDLEITVGMEPTARLEVLVLDDKGNPLPNARVATWPNVRYGEWSATILASDLYNSFELFTSAYRSFHRSVPDFEAISDDNGVAVLANLPATVKEFTVQHEKFAMPAVQLGGWSRKERQAQVSLRAGQTNFTSVQLEPIGASPIAHY